MPVLIRLFTDLSVYKEVVVGSFPKAFGRFALSYLILTLIFSWWLHLQFTDKTYSVMSSVTNQFTSQIPATGTFGLQNHTLIASGSALPITISYPATATQSPFLYINPSADASALASSSAVLALGKTHFRLSVDNGSTYELRSYQEEGWPNATVSGTIIKTEIDNFNEYAHRIKSLIPLLLTTPLFIFFFFNRLFQTVFYSLLLTIFGSTLNRNYHFSNYWKLTLHTIIVADAINLLVVMIYHQYYPAIFTVAFIGTTVLAFLRLPVEPKQPTKLQL